jgi:ATP-dependent Lon protease
LSAFTKQPISPDIAFTGEVSLTGACLPIGGLNEKALAALAAGVKTLHLPEGNKKDVAELPDPAKKGLKIYPHKHIDEIVKILFKVPKAGQAKDERLKTKETQVEKPAKSVSKKSSKNA